MPHSRKLILMIGESGSGKSTIAREMVAKDPDKYVRISRDDLRLELAGQVKKGKLEDLVIKVQVARAFKALDEDKNVIIDDTNLNPNTQDKWKNRVNHKAEYAPYRVFTDLPTCIIRDAYRVGSSHVGRAVIERQFCLSGRMKDFIDPDKPILICDIDGTVASHDGIRSPFDERKVGLDTVHSNIRYFINSFSKTHTIFFVSGRHSTCSDDTCFWLEENGITMHHILMRASWDNRSDTVVKREILDEIRKNLHYDNQIDFVIDDRPKVVRMWREAGVNVKPVYKNQFLTDNEFFTEHRMDCSSKDKENDGRCEECGALKEF
ncbi:MAG: AAA family ATPase [Janthinobacterium lividum]